MTEGAKLIKSILVAVKNRMSQKCIRRSIVHRKREGSERGMRHLRRERILQATNKKVAFFSLHLELWTAADNMKSAWEFKSGNWEAAKKF